MDYIVSIRPEKGGSESKFLFQNKEQALLKMQESEEWNKEYPDQKCVAELEHNGKVIKRIK